MEQNRPKPVKMDHEGIVLHGFFESPPNARGIILFAHGSGSGRTSPRNQRVARYLNQQGLATLLLDLLTEDEEDQDRQAAQLRFNISFLARRLLLATDWLQYNMKAKNLGFGYFGASTGAAAALVAAAIQPELIQAVVSRGGRPDLAAGYLNEVRAPTLLIVGSHDHSVVSMNEKALHWMKETRCKLETIPGAGHLFEEPGTMDRVAELAADWFLQHLHARHDEGRQHL